MMTTHYANTLAIAGIITVIITCGHVHKQRWKQNETNNNKVASQLIWGSYCVDGYVVVVLTIQRRKTSELIGQCSHTQV